VPLNFRSSLVALMTSWLILAYLSPSTALADGGPSIAAAPGIAYGQQEFGSTATGGFESQGCCACPVYNSYWLATVVAGDRVTVNWEGAANSTYLAVYPVHTTDFTVATTDPAEEQGLNSNGKNQLVFAGSNCTAAYDPDTGKQIWIIDGPTEQFVASLVYRNDVMFMTYGFPKRGVMGTRPGRPL